MPGLVGFVGQEYPDEGQEHLRKMTLALEPSPEYRVEIYHEPGIGLGWVGHKFADAGPQPCWNESKTLCAVMEGELYNSAELRQDLIQRGESVQTNSEIELVLKLYQLYGDDFPVHLNGAFVVAIWDQPRRRLVLVNDRLGLHPLYYASYNGGLSFASGVRALLADPALPRKTDRVAIAEFLTFDHLLDDRTLLESVRLMPQGSLLIFFDGQVQIKRYYDICFPRGYKLRSEEDYMEEFLHLVQQAVKRQIGSEDRKLGILLSGGLDSRLLLADLSTASDGKAIHSFTWGMPGCDDARNAREIARLLGSQHHFFELKPDWLLGLAHEAVRLTDGMGNLVNLHALATLQEEASIANVLFKGFLGDAMMGFGLRQQFWANYDEPTWVQAHLQVHTDQGVITFNNQERQQLFSDAFRSEVGTAVIDHYVAGMKEAPSDSMADQRIYFDYRQRVPRMTIKGVEVVRSKVVTRLPFADNDLVEFSLRLPPGLRYERRLMKNAFIRAFPKLAQVPVTETGLPMMLCSRDVLLRANYVVRWHLNSVGLKWVSTNLRRPYKDYNQWFRSVLRAWMESILLSPRALERGFYNPEYIRRLVTEHQAGANYAVRLGALLAIEIWHQMYLD